MSDSNLNSSINSIKSNLLTDIPTATVTELVNIARSLKGINLWNDSTIETAVNDRAITLISSASASDIVKISTAIKSMMGPDIGADVEITSLNTVTTDLIPDTNITHDLGSASNRFNDIYLDGNTIHLGDQTITTTATGLSLTELKIGTGNNTVTLNPSTDGVMQMTGTDSSGNAVAQIENVPSIQSVTNFSDLLSIANPATGAQMMVTSTNRLFIYTGTGWYKIADMANESPTAITGVNSTYNFTGGDAAFTITAISSDPEGFPLTWSHTVSSGALNGTTVTAVDNVFTITPHSENAATFGLTISVTDGVGVATFESAFTASSPMPSVDILVVGGGGGGGAWGGAGGGSGEYKIWTGILNANVSYNVSVGAGGEDPPDWQTPAGAGTPSQIYSGSSWRIRSGGGGGGAATFSAVTGAPYYNGGGSTGGGSRSGGGATNSSAVPTNIYNSATDFGTGYRTRGGSGSGDHGGGAGGAGQAGGNANGNASGGHGGDGKIWLDGNYYAGGGSGGADYQQYNSNTPGGLGGGGAGREYYPPNGDHGTGGGGGGAFDNSHSVFVSSDHGHDGYQAGTFGGNGVIIIRVPETAAQPTVTGTYVTTTTTGGYTYYKWAQLGAYGGAGGPTSQVHDALSLSFEANRATTTGTIIWNT